MEGKPWRIESPGASITDNVDQATLALRLGIAVNAMRAVQKFFYNFRDTPGPAGERDRLWAFLIAMGYLKEAIELLRPKFPVIKELALKGGGATETIDAAAALLSGKSPLSPALDRLRNKLVFHWDEEPIREYAKKFTADRAVWAEGMGDTNGEMFYRAPANALTNSLLPDDSSEPDTPERNRERIAALMKEAGRATNILAEVFDRAIGGHLKQYDTRTVEETT